MRLNGFVLALKFELSCKQSQILIGDFAYMKLWQILKFHERVISALKFELSCKRSQILVVNSCEWMKVFKFAKQHMQ